ncbi:hypothetical protein L596_000232 [Steinernema carpocapsae]|uniref:Uncharacterized protein n=1 Tax=Steinernema carpocapsae TaxID=34508 RepID=A0A4U8UI47_STECR|nr:hypothetical protein L596_000232 [Steinernema carpocapsae]
MDATFNVCSSDGVVFQVNLKYGGMSKMVLKLMTELPGFTDAVPLNHIDSAELHWGLKWLEFYFPIMSEKFPQEPHLKNDEVIFLDQMERNVDVLSIGRKFGCSKLSQRYQFWYVFEKIKNGEPMAARDCFNAILADVLRTAMQVDAQRDARQDQQNAELNA